MHTKPLPLSFYVDNLNNGTPFSLSRYGDGEFLCMTGRGTETCDHQAYTKELASELFQTLAHPRNLVYCLGPRATSQLDIVAFMRRRGLRIEWHDSETLLDASTRGDLFPFVLALRQHRVMVVGPDYLEHHPAVQPEHYVNVPCGNAFAHRTRIRNSILDNCNRADVVLISAGPTAKLLVWDLVPAMGTTHFLLDVGSLFDWYSGVDSRSYSRKWSAEERERLRRVNLGL